MDTQPNSRVQRMLAAISRMTVGESSAALNRQGKFRSGTPMRKVRVKKSPHLHAGVFRVAGTKLVMLAHHHRLGLTNPGGGYSEYFRDQKQIRMAAIQKKRGYGNCAGQLH